ncbi:MAG: flippase [Gemmatimonadota bacterium]|nr:flippase [Gemmatimonadota bacterium]
MGGESPVRRIAGNTAVQVIGRAIEFAIFLFLVHYLDLKAFGAYTFILTNLMLWGVLADAGTYNVLIREAASRENADRLLENALSVGLIASIAAILTSNAFLYLAGQGRETLIPALIASLTLFVSPRLNAFRRMFQVRFQAELRMGYVVAWNTASHLLMAGLLVAVVLNKGLLVAIFCALIAAESLSFAGLCITHRRLFKLPRFRFDPQIVRTLLRQSIPLMLASICVTVHDKIGIMLLESIKGKEAVGLYNMAARIPDSLPFLASIFIASVFPVMVRHRESDPVAFDRIYRRSARYLLLFIVPIAGFCTLASNDILNLLFPGRIPKAMFGHASGTLVLLIWAMVFKYMGTAFSFLIVAVGQEKRRLVCLGAAALLGILLNVALIPAHHVLGSAAAVLIGSIAYPVAGLFFAPLRKYAAMLGAAAVKPLLATALTALCVSAVTDHFVVAAAVGLLVYGALILLFKGVTREDVALLKEMRKSR